MVEDFMGGEPLPGYDSDLIRGKGKSGNRKSFHGVGPKGYKRSDHSIEEDLHYQLTQDPYIDASDVILKVRNGHVVLSGTVPNKWMKYSIEEIAEYISGVTGVEDHIKVEY